MSIDVITGKSRKWSSGPRKRTKAQVREALAVHERIQAESDAIRATAGLPPVAENGVVTGWREQIEKGAKGRA